MKCALLQINLNELKKKSIDWFMLLTHILMKKKKYRKESKTIESKRMQEIIRNLKTIWNL